MVLQLNMAMFPVIVLFLSILILFFRKAYKYSDSRFLFFAFVLLILSGLFSLDSGTIWYGSLLMFSHAFGAVAGWLLAFDTFYPASRA